VTSTNALKPGKYLSTSSGVLALLAISWGFSGRGTHSLTRGSSIRMSFRTLLWSRSKVNPRRIDVT
jgi:hypothetical protein